METREQKRETGQISSIDNKDLKGFAVNFPKETMLRKLTG